MITVIGGIKGGGGKTTIATNLAVMRASEGKKVLLVDADEQRSASDWAMQRESLETPTSWVTIQLSGKSIHSQLRLMSSDYDDIIVDVGGRDTTSQRSALAIANLCIIPFKPRSLDIWTIGNVKNMISEIKAINPALQVYAVINQADPTGSDTQDSQSIINTTEEMFCLPFSIGYRKSFANAAAEGRGVMEIKKMDIKAAQEIKNLYDYIYHI